MPDIKPLQEDDFSEEALKRVNRMAVLFESPWCQGCHAIEKMILGLTGTEAQDCQWGKVDVSQHQGVAQRFGVLSLPTLLVFRDGQLKERMTGKISREKLLEAIK